MKIDRQKTKRKNPEGKTVDKMKGEKSITSVQYQCVKKEALSNVGYIFWTKIHNFPQESDN